MELYQEDRQKKWPKHFPGDYEQSPSVTSIASTHFAFLVGTWIFQLLTELVTWEKKYAEVVLTLEGNKFSRSETPVKIMLVNVYKWLGDWGGLSDLHTPK